MKERADDSKRSKVVIQDNTVTYRGQTFPLGKAPRGTVIPLNGKNTIKALRLRLAELEG